MAVRHTALAAIVLSLLPAAASAATFTLLKTFCESTNCRDGNTPGAPLLRDPDGNLFGTTVVGGAHGKGVVFEMRKTGAGYTYQRVYDFCSQPGCTDGHHPYGGLIMDQAGNLYGAASEGGNGAGGARGGAVFKLSPRAKPFQEWIFTKLHDFCAKADCADGKTPMASPTYQGAASGALYDGVSPLYGTTQTGGIHERGAVFALVRSHGHRVYAKLHDFCNDADCTDGALPYAGITVDATGNTLYGTTFDGGAGNSGTAYKLVRGNEGWTHSVIHDFCPSGQAPCADGSFPQAGLALDAQGNLYGTTENGGDDSFGTVFEISAAGQYRRLHSFCAEMGCPDGSLPYAGVTIDGEGHLWGATNQGGPGFGTLFRLSGPHLTTFKTAATLGVPTGNGGYPNSPPTRDASGALIGVTQFLGDHSGGVFYRLRP